MRAAHFFLLAFLAGCEAESGLPTLPVDQVRALFPAGGVVDAIEIDAVDRLPLRAAELVAPDGEATPASYLHVNPSPGVTFYQRFPDGRYAGNVFGVGNLDLGTPLPANIAGAPQGNARLLAMVSTASIPLPDEVAYRRDWRSYRIFLSFGDFGERSRKTRAPRPRAATKGIIVSIHKSWPAALASGHGCPAMGQRNAHQQCRRRARPDCTQSDRGRCNAKGNTGVAQASPSGDSKTASRTGFVRATRVRAFEFGDKTIVRHRVG